jgi:hypothetical protein
METIAAGCATVLFVCTVFNYIVIKPLKGLIDNVSDMVKSIQNDLKLYNVQREETEKRVSILEVRVSEIEKKIEK